VGGGAIGQGSPAGKRRTTCTRHLEDSPSQSGATYHRRRCAHHLPSQLNAPIPVDPGTLLERLPRQITDFSTNLKMMRTSKVQDAFPDRLEGYLQIIITIDGK